MSYSSIVYSLYILILNNGTVTHLKVETLSIALKTTQETDT